MQRRFPTLDAGMGTCYPMSLSQGYKRMCVPPLKIHLLSYHWYNLKPLCCIKWIHISLPKRSCLLEELLFPVMFVCFPTCESQWFQLEVCGLACSQALIYWRAKCYDITRTNLLLLFLFMSDCLMVKKEKKIPGEILICHGVWLQCLRV